MFKTKVFTLDVPTFKRFRRDKSVWPICFVRDVVWVVDGVKIDCGLFDGYEIEYLDSLKDSSRIGIYSGIVFFDNLPDTHLFAKTPDGKISDLMLAWCRQEGIPVPAETPGERLKRKWLEFLPTAIQAAKPIWGPVHNLRLKQLYRRKRLAREHLIKAVRAGLIKAGHPVPDYPLTQPHSSGKK